ncbi:hypothetical protein KEM54_005389 [Ascosphaera aggregata]|nr:hypothetical protein KEM54_005389 [Ascosphaera aggregata]
MVKVSTKSGLAPGTALGQGYSNSHNHRSPLQDGTNKANASPSPSPVVKSHNPGRHIKRTSVQIPTTPTPVTYTTPSIQTSPSRIPILKPLGPRALSVRDDKKGRLLARRPHSSMGFDRSGGFHGQFEHDPIADGDQGEEHNEVKININRFPTTPTTRRPYHHHRAPRTILSSSSVGLGEEEQPRSPRWTVPPPTTTVATNLRIKTHIGPWKLGCTIGKGTTSRVRVAKHITSGVTAAIKIISKRNMGNTVDEHGEEINGKEKTTKKILSWGVEREVVIMKLMEHPNIVELFDVWESKGELFLILEYASAGSLFTYLSTRGALAEQEAMRFFRQIIGAVSSIHSYRICHRDLKPENILLDQHMNAKLADFGMAAFQPEDTMLTTSCGSPHYAAPEVIAGKPYRGDKADIWSCGVILYAMLAGYLPFDSGDIDRTLSLVCAGDYVIPPWFGRATRSLVQSMLRKRVADRLSGKEILQHPAMRKYQREHKKLFPELDQLVYGDELLGMELNDKKREMLPAESGEVDEDIFAAMTVLWKDADQAKLFDNLLNDEVNYEKLFYKGLLDYRTEQLEQNKEYLSHSRTNAVKVEDMPMLTFPANSPLFKVPRASHSPQSSVSRVKSQLYGPRPGPISSAEERNRRLQHRQQQHEQPQPHPKPIKRSENIPVVPSYDPYRASRMKLIDPDQVEHMKITVYPPKIEVAPQSRYQCRAVMRSGRPGLAKSLSGKRIAPSQSASGCMKAAGSGKAKRNVSFQNVREVSNIIRKYSREHESGVFHLNGGTRDLTASNAQRLNNAKGQHPHRILSSSSPPLLPIAPHSDGYHGDITSSHTLPDSSPLSLPTPSPPPASESQQLKKCNDLNELYVRRKRVRPGTSNSSTGRQSSAPVIIPAPSNAQQRHYELLQDARKASREIEMLCEEAFNHAHKQVKSGRDVEVKGSNVAQNHVVSSAAAAIAVGKEADSTESCVVDRDNQECWIRNQAAVEDELVQQVGQITDSALGSENQGFAMSSVPILSHDQNSSGLHNCQQQSPSPNNIRTTKANTQKPAVQSTKPKAWNSLEAALKSLETLCPEAPISPVQFSHPSLAPPSRTLEQLKKTQRQLNQFIMSSSEKSTTDVFQDIQERLNREIAALDDKQQELEAKEGDVATESDNNKDIKEAVSSEEDMNEWNRNIARFTRCAEGATHKQSPRAFQQDQPQSCMLQPGHGSNASGDVYPRSGSTYNERPAEEREKEGMLDVGLGVKPLTIRKKEAKVGADDECEDESGRAPKHSHCSRRNVISTERNARNQEVEIEDDDEDAITPCVPANPQSRKRSTRPKKRGFQAALEPIAEHRSSSGSSEAGKKGSGQRSWSWSKNDDKCRKQRGDGSALRLPSVPENPGDGKRNLESVGRTRSKGERLRSLFCRKRSSKSGAKVEKAPEAVAAPQKTTAKPEKSPTDVSRPFTDSDETLKGDGPSGDSQAQGKADGPSIPNRESSKIGTWSRLSRQLFSNNKPVTREIVFHCGHEEAEKEVRKIMRQWRSCGLSNFHFDAYNHKLRGTIAANNTLEVAPLEFSGAFFMVKASPSPDMSNVVAEHSLLSLKLKKGAEESLHELAGCLMQSLKEKEGLLVSDEGKVRDIIQSFE